LSETKSHIGVERGSEKSFGIVFTCVFLIIAFFPLFYGESFRIWASIVAGIFLALALFAPNTLVIPNKLWFKFGMILGAFIAPIVMTLLYFIAVMPTGLFIRLTGKDLLRQKFDKNKKSYWIKREQPIGSMKDQF
jgi:hypothetical protein